MGMAYLSIWTRYTSEDTRGYGLGKAFMIHRLASRSFFWILKKVGIFTLVTLALLLVAFSSLAYGLQSAVPILRNYYLLFYVTLGIIIGWNLAKTKLVGWKIIIISTLIGMILILIDLARLLPPILYLSREASNVIYHAIKWPWNSPPDLNIFLLLLSDITYNIKEVLFATYQWLQALSNSQTIIRSSGSILFWLLTLWATSIWAGWSVRRIKKPLISILPAGILLASMLNYVRKDTYFLYLLLLSTLSLIAYIQYTSREQNWELNALDYPEDIRIDYTFTVGAILFILISIALITPAISLRPLATAVRNALSDQISQIDIIADSLGISDQITNEHFAGDIHTSSLPRSHLLGSDPQLSQNVLMIVKIHELEQAKYYWRGLAYDIYDGKGWSTSEISITSHDAGDSITQIIYPSQRIINLDIHITRNIGSRLLTAGTLLSADNDYQVSWRSSTDMFGALISSPIYQVSSLVNQTSETQLRSANNEYPNWITTTYLNLPQDLPDRVRQLALDLTEDQPTAYDKALAIEAYLRTYPYSLDIPLPPKEQDVIDYFLFDLKKGYCDYYATTMVVLARAAGLPARLVVGYSSGLFDSRGNRYIVTEADAHSWPEIFFPEFGWIEFEPTGGQPPIGRPANITSEYLPNYSIYNELTDPISTDRLNDKFSLWRLFPYTSLTILVIIIVLVLILDDRNLRKTEPEKAVIILYSRLHAHGQKLEVPMSGGYTPNEFTTAMKGKLNELMAYFPSKILTSRINQNLNYITNLYIQLSYSPHPLGKTAQSGAIQSWHHVRFWILIARIINNGRKFYRKILRPKTE
jgi:transglutaminase-like putative cysteine protease